MQKIFERAKGLSTVTKYTVVLFISLLLMFLYFAVVTWSPLVNFPLKLWSALADASVIVLLSLLLRGKWKIISAAFPFLMALLLAVNVLYFRNFGDLIPPSQYLVNDLSDPVILDNAKASLRFFDVVFFIVVPFVPLVYIIFTDKASFFHSNFKYSRIGLFAIAVLVIWLVPYSIFFTKKAIRNHSLSFEDNLGYLFVDHDVSWRFFYDNHNFSGYLYMIASNASKPKRLLSDAEVKEIKGYLGRKETDYPALKNVFDGNKDKNLIMIVVESLPYRVFKLREANIVMPYLDSVASSPDNVVKRCLSLVGYGRSSDAHFIYNTGLLPLREEPLVVNYASRDFPSIAKALDRPSIEIIGEKKYVWSHEQTSRSYGFDRLVSDLTTDETGQDSIIFNNALREIRTLRQPFFALISTLTTHSPFTTQKINPRPDFGSLSYDDPRDREYLERLWYADSQIASFIENLKRLGIYDNSVVVIIGDHEIGHWNISPYLNDDSVPFIILNAGNVATRDSGITQADVFPTLLDLMNARYRFYDTGYRGVGKSIFMTSPSDSVSFTPSDTDYLISEMIITGIRK